MGRRGRSTARGSRHAPLLPSKQGTGGAEGRGREGAAFAGIERPWAGSEQRQHKPACPLHIAKQLLLLPNTQVRAEGPEIQT